MKITMVGAALIIAAAVVVVLVVRVLTSKSLDRGLTGPASQSEDTGQAHREDTREQEQQ